MNAIAFAPGATLVSGGSDGHVVLWDILNGSRTGGFTESSAVKAVRVTCNDEFLITGCDSGEVAIRKLDSPDSPRTVKAQPGRVYSLAAGWGPVFAAGGNSEKITVIDARTGKLLKIGEISLSAMSLAFGGQGRCLAAGCGGGMIYLWLAE